MRLRIVELTFMYSWQCNQIEDAQKAYLHLSDLTATFGMCLKPEIYDNLPDLV